MSCCCIYPCLVCFAVVERYWIDGRLATSQSPPQTRSGENSHTYGGTAIVAAGFVFLFWSVETPKWTGKERKMTTNSIHAYRRYIIITFEGFVDSFEFLFLFYQSQLWPEESRSSASRGRSLTVLPVLSIFTHTQNRSNHKIKTRRKITMERDLIFQWSHLFLLFEGQKTFFFLLLCGWFPVLHFSFRSFDDCAGSFLCLNVSLFCGFCFVVNLCVTSKIIHRLSQ